MKTVVLICFFIATLLFSIGGVAYFRGMDMWGIWVLVGLISGFASIVIACEHRDDM